MGNVLSGFTTAIIGAPFAFFLIQGLLRRNSQQKETDRLRMLVQHNLRQMEDALQPPGLTPNDYERMMADITEHIKNLRSATHDLAHPPNNTFDGPDTGEGSIRMSSKEIEHANLVRREAISTLTVFLGKPGSINWTLLRSRWSQIASVLTLAYPERLMHPEHQRELDDILQSRNPYENAHHEFVRIGDFDDFFNLINSRRDLRFRELPYSAASELHSFEEIERRILDMAELADYIRFAMNPPVESSDS